MAEVSKPSGVPMRFPSTPPRFTQPETAKTMDTARWSHLRDIPGIALSPLDGRYRTQTLPLTETLSEPALNRMRLHVEVEWLIAQCNEHIVPGAPKLTDAEVEYLRAIPASFGAAEVDELAEIERETVHDVKAVEYFIARRLAAAADVLGPTTLTGLTPLIHFACTSEDINNLAYALQVKHAVQGVWLPAARVLVGDLESMARDTKAVPMLARTHGQAATPTTVGKELAVFAHRLQRQLSRIEGDEYLGKFNGATGTFGAHLAAVPDVDWPSISWRFVEYLGLTWNPLTTQIESHDWQAELYADIARFNRIAHNLATDMWTYISLGYFAQTRGQGTVGSSTMPHKVNPIRFENAEANFELSNAILDVLGSTLVTSRMQRDLTDSTSQRNIGTAFGHGLLAIDNLRRGLAGLDVNEQAMARDLDGNWEVLGEAIQSAMRVAAVRGVPNMGDPYERLKELTRGREVNAGALRTFVASLGLPRDIEDRLSAMTPRDYVGLAEELTDNYL